MSGYIRRRGKGTWEVTVRLGRDPSTLQYRRRFIAVKGTKKDAERVLAEALHQRDTGIDVSPGKLTVADYLRRWLRDYAAHNVGHQLSPDIPASSSIISLNLAASAFVISVLRTSRPHTGVP